MTLSKQSPLLRQTDSIHWMGMLPHEWILLFLFSLAGFFLFETLNLTKDLWTGMGLWLTMVVFGHLCFTVNRCVAFPGLIAFAGCLQWIVAPWMCEFFPPNFALFRRVLPLDDYMGYVVPATFMFWLGLHLPARKEMRRPVTFPDLPELSPRLQRTLVAIIIGGLVIDKIAEYVPGGLFFFLSLLGLFRFSAALCLMLTRTKGWADWRIWVSVVFFHLFLQATEGGLFYQIIHWGGFFMLVYGFQQHWRWKLALILSGGLVCLSVLQMVKQDYRTFLEEESEVEAITRFQKLESLIEKKIVKPENNDSGTTFGDVLVRFNQGWIIGRIMNHVPRLVPFAQGETVRDALIYTLLPRQFFPGKPEGASKAVFAKFTGLPLRPSTSMGLGVIGELYANFGVRGGAAATLVYGWIVGLIFARFLKLSCRNMFWWAAGSVVLLPAVEPGWNIEDISNHVFKAGILLLVLLWAVPWLRRFLAPAPQSFAQTDAPADKPG